MSITDKIETTRGVSIKKVALTHYCLPLPQIIDEEGTFRSFQRAIVAELTASVWVNKGARFKRIPSSSKYNQTSSTSRRERPAKEPAH